MNANIHRCMIVPAAIVEQVRGLADAFGPAAQNMWTTALSPTGELPATHWISTGHIGIEFAGIMSLKQITANGKGEAIVTDTPADPKAFVALAKEHKLTPPPESAIEAIMAQVDVSDQEPFAAMARLGLKMIQGEI